MHVVGNFTEYDELINEYFILQDGFTYTAIFLYLEELPDKYQIFLLVAVTEPMPRCIISQLHNRLHHGHSKKKNEVTRIKL